MAAYAVQAGHYWLVPKGRHYVWKRGDAARHDAALFSSEEEAQAVIRKQRGGTSGALPMVVPAPSVKGEGPRKKTAHHYFSVRRRYSAGNFEWLAADAEGFYWTSKARMAEHFPTQAEAEAANEEFVPRERGVVRKVYKYK